MFEGVVSAGNSERHTQNTTCRINAGALVGPLVGALLRSCGRGISQGNYRDGDHCSHTPDDDAAVCAGRPRTGEATKAAAWKRDGRKRRSAACTRRNVVTAFISTVTSLPRRRRCRQAAPPGDLSHRCGRKCETGPAISFIGRNFSGQRGSCAARLSYVSASSWPPRDTTGCGPLPEA